MMIKDFLPDGQKNFKLKLLMNFSIASWRLCG